MCPTPGARGNTVTPRSLWGTSGLSEPRKYLAMVTPKSYPWTQEPSSPSPCVPQGYRTAHIAPGYWKAQGDPTRCHLHVSAARTVLTGHATL